VSFFLLPAAAGEVAKIMASRQATMPEKARVRCMTTPEWIDWKCPRRCWAEGVTGDKVALVDGVMDLGRFVPQR
jgi:hypothetical protein